MNKNKIERSFWRETVASFKRIGAITLATTIALSVPAVSNVMSKVSPFNLEVSAAETQVTNLMNVDDILTTFHINHNDEYDHWTHAFQNDGDMLSEGPEFDLTDLTYVVKFPDALSHLLEDDYVTDYLFGKITNFGSAQNSFMITGRVIDENGEEATIAKDTHKPYEHISINKETNSIEFDFNRFYTDNKLEPFIRQNVNGEYIFNTLGFSVPIVVSDSRMLDNGTYEFKSAIVRGTSVDLDNVSNAYSEDLIVDYSTDPESADTDELESLIEEAKKFDATDYTEESFAALTTAIEEAEEILENGEATQRQVDDAVTELQAAIDGLVEPEPEVDTSKLEALLEKANDKVPADDYTEESFAVLTAAIEEAEGVLEDESASQEDVEEALEELQSAIDGLEEAKEEEPSPEVDMSELEDLIEDANRYDSSDYTKETFLVLTTAIAMAEEVIGDENATQEDVEEALEELQNAIGGLVEAEEPEVDTADLKALIKEADEYDSADYTEDTFAALTAAILTAEAIIDNEESTQEHVDNALNGLQNAIDSLVEAEEPAPKPEANKEGLEAALAEAEGYDSDNYTEGSYVRLSEAITTAASILDNEAATQEEVDAAEAGLENAIRGLVEEPEVVEDDSEENDEETSPIIDDDSDGSRLPDTATNTFSLILIGSLFIIFGGMLAFFRRRKMA